MAKLRVLKWGKVNEIAHVSSVLKSNGKPTSGFQGLTTKLKHLASWRRQHMFGGHTPVQMAGTRKKVRPSSNMSLKQKLEFIRKRES